MLMASLEEANTLSQPNVMFTEISNVSRNANTLMVKQPLSPTEILCFIRHQDVHGQGDLEIVVFQSHTATWPRFIHFFGNSSDSSPRIHPWMLGAWYW